MKRWIIAVLGALCAIGGTTVTMMEKGADPASAAVIGVISNTDKIVEIVSDEQRPPSQPKKKEKPDDIDNGR